MKFKKILSVSAIFLGLVSLSSCSIFDFIYKKEFILDGGATVNVTSGETFSATENVIKPDDYEYRLTMKEYEENSIYNVKYLPSTGDAKLLVIPIDLSSILPISKPYPATSTVKSNINETFFGSGSNLYFESVSSFYQKSSYNQLNITGTVTDWYDVSKSGFSSLSGINSEDAVIKIMNDAIDYLNINTSDYDANKDGYIDGVWLVYNYYDYITAKSKGISLNSNYWAYTYWDQNKKTPSLTNPVTNCFAWASYDFILEKGINNVDAHTFIHETGHMLGLSDYYDYNSKISPLGGVDMMDANIIDHNYYSKMLLGWVKPYIVTGDCSIVLSTTNDKNNFFIIPYNECSITKVNNKYYFNPFDEYMLVEYYSPTGLNKIDSQTKYSNGYQGYQSSGFRVYHVDARLIAIETSKSGYTATYYSGEDVSTGLYVLRRFSTNTGSGSNGENEEKIYAELRNLNVKFSDFHYSNYYNEIMLIDKSGRYSNYTNPFVSTTTEKIVSSDDKSLFTKGDNFSISTYSEAFINSKFNNQKTFDSNIKFN